MNFDDQLSEVIASGFGPDASWAGFWFRGDCRGCARTESRLAAKAGHGDPVWTDGKLDVASEEDGASSRYSPPGSCDRSNESRGTARKLDPPPILRNNGMTNPMPGKSPISSRRTRRVWSKTPCDVSAKRGGPTSTRCCSAVRTQISDVNESIKKVEADLAVNTGLDPKERGGDSRRRSKVFVAKSRR